MQFGSAAMQMFIRGIGEAFYMAFLSPALSYVVGIPLGIAPVVTDKNGISPVPLFNKVLGLMISALRFTPFITLLIMMTPTMRMIVGRIIGCNATVVSLVTAAASYIGRMVESSSKEVDTGVVEVAKSMEAFTWQIITGVLLPEVKPPLLVGTTISVITILGYSVMVSFTGGSGLGDTAIRHGYHRHQTDMIMVTAVFLIAIMQLIQEVFMRMSRRSDERVRRSRACLIRTTTGGTGRTESIGRNR